MKNQEINNQTTLFRFVSLRSAELTKKVFKLNPKLLSKPEHVKKFNTENGLNFDL